MCCEYSHTWKQSQDYIREVWSAGGNSSKHRQEVQEIQGCEKLFRTMVGNYSCQLDLHYNYKKYV